MNTEATWIVSQLGAREHYAIPRALYEAKCLERVITDFWCPPTSWVRKCQSLGRLHERWHSDLAFASVDSSATWFFREELTARLHRSTSWDRILRRNDQYQNFAVKRLRQVDHSEHVLFSYSYTARRLLEVAQSRGWFSVVGQIDPGPEEERIVALEHERYAHVQSRWRPAPSSYWDQWREEMERSDHILVNSAWSAECLAKENIAAKKISIVPLVYASTKRFQTQETGTADSALESLPSSTPSKKRTGTGRSDGSIEILFLGQINLRKGIGRLIDAMRLLSDDRRFQLTLAGPSEVDSALWSSLPNVRWIGPLKRSEVSDVYRSADAFVLPTLSDGYALTQLEALSNGLPVIASRQCGGAVQHGSNGMILENLEPETIAATISAFPAQRLTFGSESPFGIEDLATSLIAIASSHRGAR